jgi:hypothetical protein
MFFWNKICGLNLCFLLFCGISSAQKFPKLEPSPSIFLIKSNPVFSDSVLIFSTKKQGLKSQFTEQIVPENFSLCNYGFFCKKELVIEKATRIPLRVRLGSLQQCNYYEGKR